MFTKEERIQIEKDLGLTEESLHDISSFLSKHSDKPVRDVFIAMFSNPDFDEIQRLFCAYIMGMDMGVGQMRHPQIMMINLGNKDPFDES